jgi:hypothetical protein
MGHVELERDKWLVLWDSEVFGVCCCFPHSFLSLFLICLKNKSHPNTIKHHIKEAIY